MSPPRYRSILAAASLAALGASTQAAAVPLLAPVIAPLPAATNQSPLAVTWAPVAGAIGYDYKILQGACGSSDPAPTVTVLTTASLVSVGQGLKCIEVRALAAPAADNSPYAVAGTIYDSVAPPPVATGGQSATWLTAAYTLTDTEAGVTFAWTLNGVPGVGPSVIQPANATAGPYTLSATAKDALGNVSTPTTVAFVLTAPPTPTIASGPPNGVQLATGPTFQLAPAATQTTQNWLFTGPQSSNGVGATATLAGGVDGFYTFAATQAVNGRTSAPVVRTFTVSSAPPSIGGGVAEGAFTKLVPTFSLSGAGAAQTYEWAVEGPTGLGGTSDTVDLGNPVDGAYTVKARLKDSLGATTAYAVRRFTLDRQKPTAATFAPEVSNIVNRPPVGTIAGGGEPITSSRWQIDDAPILSGPSFSTTGLADGTHTLRAWITDRAGNESDVATRAFKLDRQAPNPPDIGPIPAATNRVPTITLTSTSGQRIQWSLTGPRNVQGDGTSPLQPNFGSLPDGDYTLTSSTQSPAGNISGTSSTGFRLDRVAPSAPKILTKPSTEGGDVAAIFSWQGEPGGSYSWVVSLNDLIVKGPTSTRETSVRLPALSGGLYTFRLSQTDAAGNAGPLSEGANFAVFKSENSTIPRVKSTGKLTRTTSKSTTPLKNLKIRTFGPLFPRAGRVLPLNAGTIHWRYRSGRLAELFNFQLFDDRGRKVYSAFPKRETLTVPRRILKVQRRYYWQIWPYWGKGRGYAPKPLGVSFFDVSPPKPRRIAAERPPIMRTG